MAKKQFNIRLGTETEEMLRKLMAHWGEDTLTATFIRAVERAYFYTVILPDKHAQDEKLIRLEVRD